MANKNSESRNPIFWCLVAIVIGAAFVIWGAVKGDCGSGPGCWHGSGFLKIAGWVLVGAGFGGWFVFGNGKKS